MMQKNVLSAELFERGVVECIDRTHLERAANRKQLRVKLGIDPTGYQLHLGHAVPLRKLRAFQDAGHQAVLIIGDFTAQIGDPTGRDAARNALSAEQTKKFAADYLDQVGKILNRKTLEVRYNSEWLGAMTSQQLVSLLSQFSVNQLLAHETFGARLKAKKQLALHELAYPIFQGYDSVAVRADVELGGSDQKFNLLAGRDVQKIYNQDQQDIMMFDYLLGTDGKGKMSKSAGNYIALEDSATDMYGKIMSIPDKLMWSYFRLATAVPEEEILGLEKATKKKDLHPRDAKARLAKEVAQLYHAQDEVSYAENHFDEVHRQKATPTAIPEVSIRGSEHHLLNLLVSHQLASSRSEARRLVEQGGVRLDQQIITDWEEPVQIKKQAVLQVGKRKFIRLVVR